MDVTLVQNAENNVNGDHRGENQDWLVRERAEEGGRRALKRGLDAWRHVQFLLGALDGVDGVAQGGVRSQIEGKRDHGKLALVIQGQRRSARIEMRECAEGNLCAVGRFHVNVFQGVRILLELRIHLEDNVILIELRKDGGDLALAEGVVKRVINVRRQNAQAGSGVAIDGERGEKALVQLVAGDITQFRK